MVNFVKNSDTNIPVDPTSIAKLLKLEASSTMKMVLFDKNGAIKEYADSLDIIKDFFEVIIIIMHIVIV